MYPYLLSHHLIPLTSTLGLRFPQHLCVRRIVGLEWDQRDGSVADAKTLPRVTQNLRLRKISRLSRPSEGFARSHNAGKVVKFRTGSRSYYAGRGILGRRCVRTLLSCLVTSLIDDSFCYIIDDIKVFLIGLSTPVCDSPILNKAASIDDGGICFLNPNLDPIS